MSTNENTPISGQFWDWMQSYWHSNRDFPPAHPDWRKKADLVNGKVPAGQLPSYVDDVLEFSSYADLPQSGEKGKIYITTKDNKQFRWGGSAYLEINSGENVMTLSTEQSISGRKYFVTSNGSDILNQKLWLRSFDGSNPAAVYYKDGYGSGALGFDGDEFRLTNVGTSAYAYLNTKGIKKDGSNDDYILLGGGSHKAISDFLQPKILGTIRYNSYAFLPLAKTQNNKPFEEDKSVILGMMYLTRDAATLSLEGVGVGNSFEAFEINFKNGLWSGDQNMNQYHCSIVYKMGNKANSSPKLVKAKYNGIEYIGLKFIPDIDKNVFFKGYTSKENIMQPINYFSNDTGTINAEIEDSITEIPFEPQNDSIYFNGKKLVLDESLSNFIGSKTINGSYNANDLSTNSITYGYSVANAPSTVGAHSFTVLNLDTTNPDYKMQLGFDGDTNEMFSRIKSNGNWTDWSRYATSLQLRNMVTIDTDQDVTGTKSYINSSGNSSLYNNKLHVKGTNGSKAGISFWSNDVGQLLYWDTGFHFKNQFDSAYQFAKASAFIKDGSDNSYILLGGGGHKPVSEFVSSADFSVVHKFDQSGGINNGSGTRINKSWFDYHWAETGKAGSVINFSGLSGAYSTELFADYYYGNSIGFRTHNGDTNSWNPVRWLWHSGNFDPNNFIPKKANQIYYGHKNPNENIGSTEIGVVSYNNNDNYSFGDYIHFGGGENNGSGYRNLVMFYKHGGGMRQYFAAPEQTTPYTDYVDYWHTGNLANPLQADDHPFASDFNDLRAKKIRLEQGWNAKNQPAGTVAGHISTFNYDINLGAQQFHSYYTNDLYLRIRNDNTYSSWQKVWHSGNFSDTDIQNWKNLSNNIFITNDQDPTNLYIKENKFGWLNGAITGAGNIKSWTGNYIAISGVPGVGHTSQLLISKNQLLFRCNYGNEDTAFNEVFHTGNFNQADYVKLNSIQIIDAHKTFNGGLASTRYEWSGSTTTPAGKVSKESAFFNLGSDYGYGISTNIGGGLDIMANQSGQPIRFWAGNGNNNPFNVVNFYKEIARYYTNISIDEGKEIRLKGPDDIAHYIKHFSDDTDGFGVSTGFAVKFYNDSSKNLLLVDGSGTYVNGNRVWDLGNFNPEWKAERENNAVGIGFEGGNIENPYMKHNAGAAYLATKNWITSSFIPKTHPAAGIGQSQINGWNNSISQSYASQEVILEDDTLKIQPDEFSLEGSGSYDIASRKKLVHVLLREGKEVNIRELVRRQTIIVFNFSKDPLSLNIEGLKPYPLSPEMQVTLYVSDEGEVLLYNETAFKKLQ